MLRADATKLPVADESLDLVVAFDVLEHLEDDVSAAKGIFNALRPGGLFVVAVPADPKLWSAHDEAVGHVRRYTRPTLTALLAGAGFEMESVRSLERPAAAGRLAAAQEVGGQRPRGAAGPGSTPACSPWSRPSASCRSAGSRASAWS